MCDHVILDVDFEGGIFTWISLYQLFNIPVINILPVINITHLGVVQKKVICKYTFLRLLKINMSSYIDHL